MIAAEEAALVLGALAFYLYDSSLLICSDEVVFTNDSKQWAWTLGADFTLAGRYLVFPGLFRPGASVIRANWHGTGPTTALRTSRPACLDALAPLRWFARLIALLLFVAMPLVLVFTSSVAAMLVVGAGLYSAAIASTLYLVRKRHALGLSPRMLASIAIDVIACPPFAVNVVRKVTLNACTLDAPQAFARTELSAQTYATLLAEARTRMAAADIPDPLHDDPPIGEPVAPGPTPS